MNEYEAVSSGEALGPMETEGDHMIAPIEFDKPNIFICGPTGSGKTTSLRNMPPESTFVINLERKALPFRHARKYKYMRMVQTLEGFEASLRKAMATPQCKYLIIDSFTSLVEIVYNEKSAILEGYDLWDEYKATIHRLLLEAKTANKYVIWLGIDETTLDNNAVPTSTIAVQGSLKGKIGKEFVICFFTDVIHSLTSDRPRYVFLTNSDGKAQAKSPMDMFPELHVDNDLWPIINRIEQYYTEE